MKLSISHPEALAWIHARILRYSAPISVVEIGCWKGGSSLVLLDAIARCGGGSLICVDDFQIIAGAEGVSALTPEVRSCFEWVVLRARLPSGVSVQLDDRGSPQAAQSVPDDSVDLAFVDGDHRYDAVIADIDAWWPKLRSGGTMVGHDYIGESGVRDAVDGRFGQQVEVVAIGDLWVADKSMATIADVACNRG